MIFSLKWKNISMSTALSPSFDTARRLSRLLNAVFSLWFWLTAIWIVCLPLVMVWPDAGSLAVYHQVIRFTDRSAAGLAGIAVQVVLATVPLLLVLHHARRLFASFARGDVFTAPVVGHIRGAGHWLIVCGVAGLFVFRNMQQIDRDSAMVMLIFGIVTTVVGYVMAEAQRIAADHAGIV